MAIKIPSELFSVLSTEETDQISSVEDKTVIYCPCCLTIEQRNSMRSKILNQGFYFIEETCKQCSPDQKENDKTIRARIGEEQARDLWQIICK